MSDRDTSFNEGNDENEPEMWDEHRWEEFFRESDKRTDKYLHLLHKYTDHPDRSKLIAIEMGWFHMLDETDDDQEEIGEYVSEDYEEGEEWKRLTDYDAEDFDDFKDLPLYKMAFNYTIDAMDLLDDHLAESDDESVNKFAGTITIPPAKIAGGFGLGFDLESLGGNIANCKRGLNAANQMLSALQEIRDKELLDQEIFLEFYRRGKEVRDELAIYIVELRERFRRGIT